LLVVPDYHHRGRIDGNRDFIAAMERHLARGDELALHGYYHQDDGPSPCTPRQLLRRRLYTREAEFDALTHRQARRRLQCGQALFRRLRWPLHGFVPPGWLLGRHARAALQTQNLLYTSSQFRLFRLPDFTAYPAPSLVWSVRSHWRRRCWRRWNEHLLRRHADAELLRLGVHPADLDYPEIEQWWLDTLTRLRLERRALTKSAWLSAQP
jgi:predicted deacetylase